MESTEVNPITLVTLAWVGAGWGRDKEERKPSGL